MLELGSILVLAPTRVAEEQEGACRVASETAEAEDEVSCGGSIG